MNYSKSFVNRIQKYINTVNKYPNAMNYEFKTTLRHLNIKDKDNVINLLAAGSPINKYIKDDINFTYKEYETEDFSEICKVHKFSFDKIPEQNNSIDKILIQAVLHHVDNNDRDKLYSECYRILKKDGILVIGDVLKYSEQANFLNVYVDKYNSNGHKGIFFDLSDKDLIIKNGFMVETKIEKFFWIFRSKEEMIDFIKNLFNLDKLDNDYLLYENLRNYLNVYHDFKWWYLDWQLIYFICKKY